MDERYETLLANLTAIAAGQQILIDRLLRDAGGSNGSSGGSGGSKSSSSSGAAATVADEAELQRIAHDLRVLLTATRLFLRAGPSGSARGDEGTDEEET